MSGDRTWVVRVGDGETVAAIAARAAPDEPRCIEEGRVFVGRTRARAATDPVRVGDVVVVHAARRAHDEATILAEEDGVVAADKPASMPTVADHRGGNHTLIASIARTLGVPESELTPTSRLDVGVSGVVLVARTRAARVRLTEARVRGVYARRYLAIATATPSAPEGAWDAAIGRGPDPRYRVANGRESAPARSRFRVVGEARGGACLLALCPETGRTHQLRVHAAHAGVALFGDVAYGGPSRVVAPNGSAVRLARIALHARAVSVPNARGGFFLVEAPVPPWLTELWASLDGPARSWDAPTWP